MKGKSSASRVAALVAISLLTSCTHRRPVAVAAPPSVAPAPKPVLAANLAAVVPPALAPDGHYRTINYGIDPVQTEWHVRAALNVAAIGCRGAADSGLVDAYNTLLKSQKAELARANTAVEAKFRAAGGDWQSTHDAYMTRLYNFFSQPAAKASFCAVADQLAPQASAPADGFQSFAAQALPQLEAPFIDTYRQVDAYKLALARWQAGEATQLAAVTPAAVAGPAPKLDYADMGVLLAWQPDPGMRVAAR